jgi:bacteriorhodopsin
MANKIPQGDKRMLTVMKLNEWLWLAFVVISVGCSVYMLIGGDRKGATYFLVLIFLSGFFYSFKRRRRKKYEQWLAGGEQEKKK